MPSTSATPGPAEAAPGPAELRQAARQLWALDDAQAKARGVHALAQRWRAGALRLDTHAHWPEADCDPGRPARPLLVPPRQVPQRGLGSPAGRAALVHALVHIEFNAIALALDAVWRFADLPSAYYTDWLRVADEEALHFELLQAHLHSLGAAYGDCAAHDGLWDLARSTAGDVLARMALLPRTLEARGLDVTPGLRARLVHAGDSAIGPILDIILRDEIGHVAVGNRWFHALCAQRGLDPMATQRSLAQQHRAPRPRGPYNLSARRQAGFSAEELRQLCPQEEEHAATAA